MSDQVVAGTIGHHLRAVFTFVGTAPTPSSGEIYMRKRGGTKQTYSGTVTVDGSTVTVDGYTASGDLDSTGVYLTNGKIVVAGRELKSLPESFTVEPDI